MVEKDTLPILVPLLQTNFRAGNLFLGLATAVYLQSWIKGILDKMHSFIYSQPLLQGVYYVFTHLEFWVVEKRLIL